MLFHFLNWCELAVTNDERQFSALIHQLEDSGIPYRTKTQNRGHNTRRGGSISGIGENQRYSNVFQIFVKKDAVEQAKHICRI